MATETIGHSTTVWYQTAGIHTWWRIVYLNNNYHLEHRNRGSIEKSLFPENWDVQ